VSSCQNGGAPSSSLDQAGEEDIGRLLAMLRLVKDSRGRQGKRYPLEYVLAVVVVATFTGAKNYTEFAEHAQDLPQDMLALLGAPYCYFTKKYLAPSLSTISDVIKGTSDHALDPMAMR
jgi:DDE_Tnp_1-associated